MSPAPVSSPTALRDPNATLDDAELRRLLSPPRREVARGRQVFVNRNLRMAKITGVGFDMDYTLAIYQKRSIEQLSFDLTLSRLVERRGYPEHLISTMRYDPAFVTRGLAVDRAHGNLLKMDRYAHVGRAYHGRRPLDAEEKQHLYRDEKISFKGERFAWIDTLFALPEACLYAEIIEALEPRQKVDFDRLYLDIREHIDQVHRDNSLKSEVRRDLPRFVTRDPELGPTLHKLRSGGKKLFLLTNSLWDYTDAVMRYLLDGRLPEYPSWRNYFDIIVTGAGKPGFFGAGQPFFEIDPNDGRPLGPARSLERGRVYQGGNLAELEQRSECAGEHILYVGDHIYGDILLSKKSSLWRTCMIVEELEDEIAYTDASSGEIGRLATLELLRARLDDEVGSRKLVLSSIEHRLERSAPGDPAAPILEEERRREKAELEKLRRIFKGVCAEADRLESAIETGFNPYWGLLFKEGTENSRFGEQVEQYACIYTSRVSNLLQYSPLQYFRSPRDFMPHERVVSNGKAGGPLLAPLGSEGPPKGSKSA